jgi:hypothetical protein
MRILSTIVNFEDTPRSITYFCAKTYGDYLRITIRTKAAENTYYASGCGKSENNGINSENNRRQVLWFLVDCFEIYFFPSRTRNQCPEFQPYK